MLPRMKTLFCTLLLLAVAAVSCPAQEAAPANVRQEAQKISHALTTADYAEVAAHTHPRVVALMGGKEAMLAALTKMMDGMKAQGVSFKEVQIGEPEKTQRVGAWLVVPVPQTLQMSVPKGRVEGNSYLLGISEDDGKTWSFVDTSIGKEKLLQIYPEFVGKLEFPASSEPKFIAD